MTRNDKAALTQCMEIARRNPRRAEHLQAKLDSGQPWEEVASFAAFGMQIEALDLMPWQAPPCIADEDHDDPHQPEAVKLLRRMLAAGVSRYDPDPMGAFERVKTKKVVSGRDTFRVTLHDPLTTSAWIVEA